MQNLKIAYDTLLKIYQNEAYASLELSKSVKDANINKGFITKLVYGVIEHDIEFDYYISKLCKKKPNNKVVIINFDYPLAIIWNGGSIISVG